MFFYKFTELDNLSEIQEKIFNNISNSLDLNESHYTIYKPDDKMFDIDIFKSSIEKKILYRDIISIGVVIQKPHSDCPIHTDDITELNCIALNIPIKNCNNTFTKFFDINPGQEPKKMRSLAVEDGYYYYYSEDQVKEIETLHPIKPVFFNLNVPHAVYNYTDNTRVLISVRINLDKNWFELQD